MNPPLASPDTLARSADRLKALGHPTRLALVCALAWGEKNVQEFCAAIAGEQPNVSQHLAILLSKRLLKTRKDGNRVYYRLADQDLLRLIGAIKETFCDAPR